MRRVTHGEILEAEAPRRVEEVMIQQGIVETHRLDEKQPVESIADLANWLKAGHINSLRISYDKRSASYAVKASTMGRNGHTNQTQAPDLTAALTLLIDGWTQGANT